MTTLSHYYETVYRPWKHHGARYDTMKLHRTAIGSLEKFVKAAIKPTKIDQTLLDDWRAWLMRRGYEPESADCYVSLVRRVCRHAEPKKWPAIGTNAVWYSDKPGTLLHYLRCTYATERAIGESTITQLGYALIQFGRFLGRAPTADDLTSENLNRFLAEYEKCNRPETVRGKRRMILTIWRAMFEAELVKDPPRRIRAVKPQQRIVTAWTHQEVERLYAQAGRSRRRFARNDVMKRDYFQLLISVAYETGLRFGDCLTVDLTKIPPDGVFQWVQSKTGNLLTCELSQQAMTLVGRVRHSMRRLGEPVGRRQIARQFMRLVREAGLVGSFKYLRRAGATAVETEQAGAATRFLGHKTSGLAMQCYVDQSQLMQQRPKPPAIGGSAGELAEVLPSPDLDVEELAFILAYLRQRKSAKAAGAIFLPGKDGAQ